MSDWMREQITGGSEFNTVPEASENSENSYFVYAEKDPLCSCCSWEYIDSEFTLGDKKRAKEYVKDLEEDGFCVTVILGREVEL